MSDDDPFNRPSISFRRIHKRARRPEQFTNTDNSFVIFSTKTIYSMNRSDSIATGLDISIPEGFVLVIQQHPFALRKGVFATSPYPLTHLHEGELLLTIYVPFYEPPQINARQVLIEVGQPFAIATLVEAPACNAYFEGWESEKVDHE